MKRDIPNEMTIIAGLRVAQNQKGRLALAFSTAFVILGLDFFLTTNMPVIIDKLQLLVSGEEIANLSISFFVIATMIVLRPLIGWIVNYIQISIIHSILRSLETEIAATFHEVFCLRSELYSSEAAANMLVSHGRYFVDDFLIPLIRAATDVGVICVISIGLLLQYPAALTAFIVSAVSMLTTYQFLSRRILQVNGEIKLRSYQDIIKASQEGLFNVNIETENSRADMVSTHAVLDRKRQAGIVVGSLSQGLKYVVEFCFMASFAVAGAAILFLQPDQFSAFAATFAYAGVRMLPSFTSVVAFFHSRNSAQQAIKELFLHLNR